ncbi:hypothetical protein [Lacticaseibacillus parakribbianus]|uniref:hypothetical protein n=1 Tax=Lacticaseibacillus parakribbianus TaxID=2970927 RepID=UPI0021CB0DC3|nr:hypothetical protein [Lacticaseibacillus parakribbianus]
MNESTVKAIMATPAFNKASSKLMGQLNIRRQDTDQYLAEELLIHRLANWTDQEILEAITSDAYTLPVLIHHARQDAARRHWAQDAKQLGIAEKIADSGMAEGVQQIESPGVLAEASEIVKAVFTNTATLQFIESVLTSGKAETMAQYNMSPRQFSKKMSDVTARLKAHQDTIRRVRAEYETRPMRAEQAELLKLVSIVESEDCSDQDIQAWIDAHQILAAELVDDPAIRYQKQVIESFANAGNTDKYRMVNNVYKRIAYINSKLNKQ